MPPMMGHTGEYLYAQVIWWEVGQLSCGGDSMIAGVGVV